jgi:predicted DCC family thiol-disulfide oxidoreductase YuxK
VHRNATDPAIPTVADGCLTVLYDGACPLCRREIGVYRDLTPTQPLEFRDISSQATAQPAQLPTGVSQEELLARFHVQHADGRLESGARAFIALWERLPYWRWLARFGRLPGMTALMEAAYRGFLRVRPTMQRWAGKRG